jgi:hypothetical protein
MRCRRPLIPISVVAAATVSALAAGCAGGSSTTAATTGPNPLVAYSECMRAHGVTGFPDPNSSGEIPKQKVVAAVVSNPRSPAAQRACRHLIPASGLGPPQTATPTRTRLADALSFARCVRAHGFPSFPDPTSQGQLTPEMVTAAGIDLHQPKVLRVGLACVPASHGLLTPAAIERAVRGG